MPAINCIEIVLVCSRKSAQLLLSTHAGVIWETLKIFEMFQIGGGSLTSRRSVNTESRKKKIMQCSRNAKYLRAVPLCSTTAPIVLLQIKAVIKLLIVIFWWISLCRSQSNCFCLCGFPRTLITLWCSVNLSPSVIRLKCHITSCQFFTLASTTPEMKVLRVYVAPIISDRHVGAKAGHWTAAGHRVVLLQISLSYFTVMLWLHFTAVGIFSDYHVLSVSTACSLLDLKYGILRTENLLDKLSWIHWRFGVCVCVCVRALCINTCWTRTNP